MPDCRNRCVPENGCDGRRGRHHDWPWHRRTFSIVGPDIWEGPAGGPCFTTTRRCCCDAALGPAFVERDISVPGADGELDWPRAHHVELWQRRRGCEYSGDQDYRVRYPAVVGHE